MLYDLIYISTQEIRILYELFDFYTNYDTNLIRIWYQLDTSLIQIVFTNWLYEFDTNHMQIVYEFIRILEGDDAN